MFEVAQTPNDLSKIPSIELEGIIRPAGLHKRKAKIIKSVSTIIIREFAGKVPKSFDCLIKIDGIGRKTANLVLGKAFGIPSICVDTHVHRIPNRIGIIKTKTPLQTEKALCEGTNEKHWIGLNKLLVKLGQNICWPIAPKCKNCKIKTFCGFYKKHLVNKQTNDAQSNKKQ